MKILTPLLLLMLAVSPCIASADSTGTYQTPLDCKYGPVTKSFGGSDWLTYSCTDGKTVVLVSASGSPAFPFYFTVSPQAGVYRVSGEGTGAKSATDPAYAEIAKLSANTIQNIINETLAVPAQTPVPAPSKPTDTCGESLPITVDNLSGTWTSMDDPNHVTVQYSSDGSFSGKVESGGKIMWLFAGTWKLDGKTMSSIYTFSSLDRIAVGTKDSDEILGIGCGVQTGRGINGLVERYRKVKD